jgi:hypothetical protein
MEKDKTLSGYAVQSAESNVSEEHIVSTTKVSHARNWHKEDRCSQYVPLKNLFTSSRLTALY